MKSISKLTALTVGFAMALITVCPISSRGADSAVDSSPQLGAPRAAIECPIVQPADPADCANGGFGPLAATGSVTRQAKGEMVAGSGPNGASGELLENLLKKNPEPYHK